MVLAGEASGDEHAARVVIALKARWPGSRFLGIGGARMKGQGVELLAELDGLAVMGLAEVIPRLPFLRRLTRRLISLLDSGDIDLLIPVDYAGFNLRIARAARQRELPVLYYIAPKIWAWGARRARKLAAYTNRLALILPFEAEALVRAGANAHLRRTSAPGDAGAGTRSTSVLPSVASRPPTPDSCAPPGIQASGVATSPARFPRGGSPR